MQLREYRVREFTSKDEIAFLIYDIYENLLKEQSILLHQDRPYREELAAAIAAIQAELKTIPSLTVGVAVFVPSAYDASVDLVNYDLIPEFKNCISDHCLKRNLKPQIY